jgi:hypothetical protein
MSSIHRVCRVPRTRFRFFRKSAYDFRQIDVGSGDNPGRRQPSAAGARTVNGRQPLIAWTTAALVAAGAGALLARRARAPHTAGASGSRATGSPLAPLPRSEARSIHGPYAAEACDACHERRDPSDPGAAVAGGACTGCHDDFRGTEPVVIGRSVHPAGAGASCTSCHNPHNSSKQKLLL